MSLIRQRDIVVIGLQQWYTAIGSNCKNIALQFARDNRVLYVNSPLDRYTLLHNRHDPNVSYHVDAMKGKAPSIVPVGERLWNLYPQAQLESINWMPFTSVFSWFNKRNNKRFAASIQQAMEELGFRDIILFNDNDIFRGFYMKELLKPSAYIYYSRDYLLGVDYWRKHGQTLEPQLIAKADAAVANSLYLADMLKQYNPHSYYVGQGCDLSLFDAGTERAMPEDMQAIPSPVIGYVGALKTLRLDINILLKIAQERPQWSLVLVGPEDEDFSRSALHSLPNVHFMGRKEVQDLPAYIRYFDVCINPQVINAVTVGNYPLKIDEYLAMGKPVVATATKTMSLFRDHVYLASSPEEYPALIEQALHENNLQLQQERITFARSHSWENSVAAIYDAIHQVMK